MYALILVHLFLVEMSHGSDTDCVENEWTHYQPRDVYLKAVSASAVYDEAEEYCRRLGGVVTKIQDQFLTDFVLSLLKNSTKPRLIWVGAHYNYKSKMLEWFDGKPFDSSMLSGRCKKEEFDLSDDKDCVVIFSGDINEWRTTQCRSNVSIICEVKHPCVTKTSFRINGSPYLEYDVWTFSAEHDVEIQCTVNGYTKAIESVRLKCMDINSTRHNLTLTKQIRLSQSISNTTCLCISISPSGSKQVAKITFLFDKEIEFALRIRRDPFFGFRSGKFGKSFKVRMLNAFEPSRFTLSKGKETLVEDAYSVKYEETENSTGILLITIFEPVEYGTYNLVVWNEFGKGLKLSFNYTSEDNRIDSNAATKTRATGYIYVIAGIIGIVVVVIVGTIAFRVWRTNDNNDTESGSNEEHSGSGSTESMLEPEELNSYEEEPISDST